MVRKCAIRVLGASAAVLLAGARVGLASHVSQLDETGDVISPSSTLDTTATLSIGNDIQNARAIDGVVRTDNPPTAPADADHGLIFSGGEGANDQILTVTGLTPLIPPIQSIRLYTITGDAQRVPSAVTIRSSTSATNSLDPNSYETILATAAPLAFTNPALLAPGAAPTDNTFASIPVTAPAGTQSLFLDFTGSTAGTRVSEIQAIVPEPATSALLVLGGLALAGRRRRN
jgi:hypothetical protein